jgi:hypothetical protein
MIVRGVLRHAPRRPSRLQYGVVCTWGLSQLQEQEAVQLAKLVAEEPLSLEEVEIDQVRAPARGGPCA